ncbi:hypothetical protein BpHYR1_008588 [Brachionus plicatilis]|uniref:Uncharacterized protein n=1 Tax=Brachionus plicatilis TaxID=10195 RepID=A0A3M7PM20_BRAPC|nr:hypothetical protein BpHYR1_008588 [Brachionus plicatilis]
MRIGQYFYELRHNVWQASGQLLGSTMSHAAEQLDRAALGPPGLVVAQPLEQLRQNHLDACGGQVFHDGLGTIIGCLTHRLVRVAKAQQQIWQHLDTVRLEKLAEQRAEHLVADEGAFSVLGLLFVVDGLVQPLQHI